MEGGRGGGKRRGRGGGKRRGIMLLNNLHKLRDFPMLIQ